MKARESSWKLVKAREPPMNFNSWGEGTHRQTCCCWCWAAPRQQQAYCWCPCRRPACCWCRAGCWCPACRGSGRSPTLCWSAMRDFLVLIKCFFILNFRYVSSFRDSSVQSTDDQLRNIVQSFQFMQDEFKQNNDLQWSAKKNYIGFFYTKNFQIRVQLRALRYYLFVKFEGF